MADKMTVHEAFTKAARKALYRIYHSDPHLITGRGLVRLNQTLDELAAKYKKEGTDAD